MSSAISAYHHLSSEVEPCSRWGVLDTTLCDKVCQWLAAGWQFYPGTPLPNIQKYIFNPYILINLKPKLMEN
jgi:hypothetical protein